MAETRNFLLGQGERLTEPIAPAGRKVEKKHPYRVIEARDRLVPMAGHVADELEALPERVCPRDEAVAVLTLHPEYLAKSYYPGRLIQEAGLQAVGSRPARVQPKKTTRNKGKPREETSTQLFVAGPRKNFRRWANTLGAWQEDTVGAADLLKIESFDTFDVEKKIAPGLPPRRKGLLLEVALHANAQTDYIVRAFDEYAKWLGADPDLERRLYAAGLCFLPVRADGDVVHELGKFSFLRVARLMPRLRHLAPVVRSWSGVKPFRVELPEEDPVDPQLKVAVFDGGVQKKSQFRRWVSAHETQGIGKDHPDLLEHGTHVTSSLLFGPLLRDASVERPYAMVDHFRVLDETSGEDEDLYDVLHRIQAILQSRRYPFVNLSIGPEEPLEDNDVHGWTAVLDDLLSDGETLASIAVGNGGERDKALRFDRVQVPSDCVNALAVGSADRVGNKWGRASYSSVGPGRSPGLVKPDVLAFGGSKVEPFWVCGLDQLGRVEPTAGTSFASPAALRLATGIRAHFGEALSPLAIKALLVHAAIAGKKRPECGWGRLPADLDAYVICPPGTARIVYQGELTAGQYLRARIPLPAKTLPGRVTIRATLCYATKTDAHHPSNYTRAGVDVVFRPHDEKFKKSDQVHPDTNPFFQLKEFSTEAELRSDAHKWEPTLHRERTKNGTSLKSPVFDIHYNAREGSAPSGGDKIRYALVITVSCKNAPELYDQIVRAYRAEIEPLQPVVEIPVRVAAS